MTSTDPDRPLRGARVLVVEDEFLIASLLADALERLGASVVGPASSVAQALGLAGEPLALALLDVNLKGTRVFPVADALRARRVPMIFVTGYDATLPGPYAAAPRLTKPVRLDTLRRIVTASLTAAAADPGAARDGS